MRIPRKRHTQEESSVLSARNIVLGALVFGCLFLIVSSPRSNDGVRLMTDPQASASVSKASNPAILPQNLASPSSSSDFQLANDESFGFFTDIPEREWKLLKERVKEIQPNYCSWCRGGNLANAWFQNPTNAIAKI